MMITTARIGCTEFPEAPHSPLETLPLWETFGSALVHLSALHQETISDPQ
jgi:hypothetical protein